MDDFDLVVIGSGPAGDKGASQAAYFGHSVAVVERRKDVGGAAIQVSGVPVKALRDTAVYLTGWSRRDVYGVGISLAPDLIMNRLRARITDVVTTMQAAVATNLERHGVTLVHGSARLAAPNRERHVVVVNDEDGGERRLTARRVLLATGSRPFHAADVPYEDPGVHDSESILSIERLPEHLVVVGGGAVGAEYASIFADLGSMVTVVSRGTRLLPTLDHEISEALADSLHESGARLLLGHATQAITRDEQGLGVHVGGEVIRPDTVLSAGGRRGNVEHLDLGAAGVEADERGRVHVDERFETTCPGIFAAGDVIGPPGLASVAMEGARVAMCRAFDIPFKEQLDAVVPTGIYTLPEVASVGLTEDEARRDDPIGGDDVECGIAYFAENARAMIAGGTDGLVKLVFRASDKSLLGAHILGEEATELIHVAQAVLHRGGTIDEFIDTTFNYPTRADAYKYAAYDGLQRLRAREGVSGSRATSADRSVPAATPRSGERAR
jgi:NAD(P) transhydrogenase